MKLKLQQYSDLVSKTVRNINKIKKALFKEDSQELKEQLAYELKSLKDLLTNKFYKKLLKWERKQLIKQYLEG